MTTTTTTIMMMMMIRRNIVLLSEQTIWQTSDLPDVVQGAILRAPKESSIDPRCCDSFHINMHILTILVHPLHGIAPTRSSSIVYNLQAYIEQALAA